MTSTGDALEVFSNAMAFEMLVSAEPVSKLATAWATIKAYWYAGKGKLTPQEVKPKVI